MVILNGRFLKQKNNEIIIIGLAESLGEAGQQTMVTMLTSALASKDLQEEQVIIAILRELRFVLITKMFYNFVKFKQTYMYNTVSYC